MRCNEIQDNLSAYLDKELPADLTDAVRAHVEQCAECRALLEELRATAGLLAALPVHPAPEHLVQDVEREIERRSLLEAEAPVVERMPERTLALHRARTWPRVAAVAATVVLGIGIGLFAWLGRPGKQAPVLESKAPTHAESTQVATAARPGGADGGVTGERDLGKRLKSKNDAADDSYRLSGKLADEKAIQKDGGLEAPNAGGRFAGDATLDVAGAKMRAPGSPDADADRDYRTATELADVGSLRSLNPAKPAGATLAPELGGKAGQEVQKKGYWASHDDWNDADGTAANRSFVWQVDPSSRAYFFDYLRDATVAGSQTGWGDFHAYLFNSEVSNWVNAYQGNNPTYTGFGYSADSSIALGQSGKQDELAQADRRAQGSSALGAVDLAMKPTAALAGTEDGKKAEGKRHETELTFSPGGGLDLKVATVGTSNRGNSSGTPAGRVGGVGGGGGGAGGGRGGAGGGSYDKLDEAGRLAAEDEAWRQKLLNKEGRPDLSPAATASPAGPTQVAAGPGLLHAAKPATPADGPAAPAAAPALAPGLTSAPSTIRDLDRTLASGTDASSTESRIVRSFAGGKDAVLSEGAEAISAVAVSGGGSVAKDPTTKFETPLTATGSRSAGVNESVAVGATPPGAPAATRGAAAPAAPVASAPAKSPPAPASKSARDATSGTMVAGAPTAPAIRTAPALSMVPMEEPAAAAQPAPVPPAVMLSTPSTPAAARPAPVTVAAVPSPKAAAAVASDSLVITNGSTTGIDKGGATASYSYYRPGVSADSRPHGTDSSSNFFGVATVNGTTTTSGASLATKGQVASADAAKPAPGASAIRKDSALDSDKPAEKSPGGEDAVHAIKPPPGYVEEIVAPEPPPPPPPVPAKAVETKAKSPASPAVNLNTAPADSIAKLSATDLPRRPVAGASGAAAIESTMLSIANGRATLDDLRAVATAENLSRVENQLVVVAASRDAGAKEITGLFASNEWQRADKLSADRPAAGEKGKAAPVSGGTKESPGSFEKATLPTPADQQKPSSETLPAAGVYYLARQNGEDTYVVLTDRDSLARFNNQLVRSNRVVVGADSSGPIKSLVAEQAKAIEGKLGDSEKKVDAAEGHAKSEAGSRESSSAAGRVTEKNAPQESERAPAVKSSGKAGAEWTVAKPVGVKPDDARPDGSVTKSASGTGPLSATATANQVISADAELMQRLSRQSNAKWVLAVIRVRAASRPDAAADIHMAP